MLPVTRKSKKTVTKKAEYFLPMKWYDCTTHAEFNARCSQAKVGNGIASTIQSDRLAFMLEKTQSSKCMSGIHLGKLNIVS